MSLRDKIVEIIRRLEKERPELSHEQMRDIAMKEVREVANSN